MLTAAQMATVGAAGATSWARCASWVATRELLATPIADAAGTRMVLVVGSSIDGYDRARERLELVLIVASPLLVGLLAGARLAAGRRGAATGASA